MDSLYLDIYRGTVNIDGKRKDLRDYEFLGIYVYPNPKTPAEREHNKERLLIAETIRNKKELELLSGTYQIPAKQKGEGDFLQFANYVVQQKSKNTRKNYRAAVKYFTLFVGTKTLPFKSITPDLCERYVQFLRQQDLHPNTIFVYFTSLKTILNEAVRKGYLQKNPLQNIEKPPSIPTRREFLTIEELRTLAQTECRQKEIKRMFLFSCLTGLRFSDIVRIRWQDIQFTEQGWRLVLRQQKTKEVEYIYLSEQARKLLGEAGNPNDFVFSRREYSGDINVVLENWVLRAGITKHITFHSARHTFAVLQLTLGTDIYTVSKLLGHKNLQTTEIYAKIIDEKKREAVNKLNDIL